MPYEIMLEIEDFYDCSTALLDITYNLELNLKSYSSISNDFERLLIKMKKLEEQLNILAKDENFKRFEEEE